MSTDEQGFATRAIHAGYEPNSENGAVNVPIYASSTFAQDGVGGMRGGYEYARSANPTRTALQEALASTPVKARFQALGVEAMPGTPAQMTAYVTTERERWGRLIQRSNIKLD